MCAAARPVPWYYAVLIVLAMPVYRWLIGKKSAKLPTYERELNERFAKAYLPVPVGQKGLIWCHAVSLGELNTAYPLLQQLLNQGFSLWITSTTQTGFGRVTQLFAQHLGKTVNHSFVPVDNAKVVGRFLEHTRPVLALFIETELWATTLFELKKRHIPSAMVNARLTKQSFLGYQKFASISHSMMANLSLIIAQDAQSATHFEQLGAGPHKIFVADSLKWSSGQRLNQTNQLLLDTILQDLAWCLSRPIWVAGSTHAGEEEVVLGAHRQLLQHHPKALLILVPRHPERFDEVAALCQDFVTHRRSRHQEIGEDTQVYLADSMGELLVWYVLSHVVFVGGSLTDVGGHNPIEPASFAKPIIMGQYVKNCEVLVQALVQASALLQVTTAEELFKQVHDWFDNPQQAQLQGKQGKDLVEQKQHAVELQLNKLLELLTPTS